MHAAAYSCTVLAGTALRVTAKAIDPPRGPQGRVLCIPVSEDAKSAVARHSTR